MGRDAQFATRRTIGRTNAHSTTAAKAKVKEKIKEKESSERGNSNSSKINSNKVFLHNSVSPRSPRGCRRGSSSRGRRRARRSTSWAMTRAAGLYVSTAQPSLLDRRSKTLPPRLNQRVNGRARNGGASRSTPRARGRLQLGLMGAGQQSWPQQAPGQQGQAQQQQSCGFGVRPLANVVKMARINVLTRRAATSTTSGAKFFKAASEGFDQFPAPDSTAPHSPSLAVKPAAIKLGPRRKHLSKTRRAKSKALTLGELDEELARRDAEADPTESEASASTAESTAPGPSESSDASSLVWERMSVGDRTASAALWDGYESECPKCDNDMCPGGCGGVPVVVSQNASFWCGEFPQGQPNSETTDPSVVLSPKHVFVD